jgi:hypothetical protein
MDVGFAAEVPEHLGTLDLPAIPDPVVPEILLLEARQVEVLQSLGLDQPQGFLGILLSERTPPRPPVSRPPLEGTSASDARPSPARPDPGCW